MSEQVNTSDANGLTINDSGNGTTYQLLVVPNHWQPSYIPRTGCNRCGSLGNGERLQSAGRNAVITWQMSLA